MGSFFSEPRSREQFVHLVISSPHLISSLVTVFTSSL